MRSIIITACIVFGIVGMTVGYPVMTSEYLQGVMDGMEIEEHWIKGHGNQTEATTYNAIAEEFNARLRSTGDPDLISNWLLPTNLTVFTGNAYLASQEVNPEPLWEGARAADGTIIHNGKQLRIQNAIDEMHKIDGGVTRYITDDINKLPADISNDASNFSNGAGYLPFV